MTMVISPQESITFSKLLIKKKESTLKENRKKSSLIAILLELGSKMLINILEKISKTEEE
jgi:hypothetical protein